MKKLSSYQKLKAELKKFRPVNYNKKDEVVNDFLVANYCKVTMDNFIKKRK